MRRVGRDQTLAVIIETRNALRLRLRVASDVAASEIRFQASAAVMPMAAS